MLHLQRIDERARSCGMDTLHHLCFLFNATPYCCCIFVNPNSKRMISTSQCLYADAACLATIQRQTHPSNGIRSLRIRWGCSTWAKAIPRCAMVTSGSSQMHLLPGNSHRQWPHVAQPSTSFGSYSVGLGTTTTHRTSPKFCPYGRRP